MSADSDIPSSPSPRTPDDGTVLPDVELQVAYLLRRADRASRRRDNAAPTLERSAYLVLQSLVVDGPAAVHVIASRLGLDASTMTRQVTALQKSGLVRRTHDETDRRSVVVHPTEAGIADLATHRSERARLYERILDSWPAEERAALGSMLSRLNRSMDEHSRH